MDEDERLLDTSEAARLLGLSPATLCKRRVSGNSPLFVKLGRSVRYRRRDLQDWAKGLLRKSTSDEGSGVA